MNNQLKHILIFTAIILITGCVENENTNLNETDTTNLSMQYSATEEQLNLDEQFNIEHAKQMSELCTQSYYQIYTNKNSAEFDRIVSSAWFGACPLSEEDYKAYVQSYFDTIDLLGEFDYNMENAIVSTKNKTPAQNASIISHRNCVLNNISNVNAVVSYTTNKNRLRMSETNVNWYFNYIDENEQNAA